MPLHAGALLPTGQPTAAPTTMGTILSPLRQIFREVGRGQHWDQQRKQGNPACCTEISQYAQGHKAVSIHAGFTERGALGLTVSRVLQLLTDSEQTAFQRADLVAAWADGCDTDEAGTSDADRAASVHHHYQPWHSMLGI